MEIKMKSIGVIKTLFQNFKDIPTDNQLRRRIKAKIEIFPSIKKD